MRNFHMKVKGEIETIEIEARDLDHAWEIAADTYKDEPEGTEIIVLHGI